jgi:hypothetical protein
MIALVLDSFAQSHAPIRLKLFKNLRSQPRGCRLRYLKPAKFVKRHFVCIHAERKPRDSAQQHARDGASHIVQNVLSNSREKSLGGGQVECIKIVTVIFALNATRMVTL